MARDEHNEELELAEHEAPAPAPPVARGPHVNTLSFTEPEPATEDDVVYVAFRLVDSIRDDDETGEPLPLQSIETAVSARHELLRLERGSDYLTSDRDEIAVLDKHPAVERVED